MYENCVNVLAKCKSSLMNREVWRFNLELQPLKKKKWVKEEICVAAE